MNEFAELYTPATGCIVVFGVMNVTGSVTDQSGGPGYFFFPEDPSVPLATCADMPGGFSPRICGPGPLFLYGDLNIVGFYAAVWAHTIVMPTGRFQLQSYGTFVGLLSNYGSAVFNFMSYMFGSATNYGSMRMTVVQFSTNFPFPGSANLNVTNHGQLEMDSFNGVGAVQITLTNYNLTLVNFNYGDAGAQYTQFMYFNQIYNHGNITFINGQAYRVQYAFYLQSDVYNIGGTLFSSGSSVYLYAYFSVGGKLVTADGGVFGFGNGAGIDRHEIRECETEMPAAIKHRLEGKKMGKVLQGSMIPCKSNLTCADPECCVGGFCQPCPCSNSNPCASGSCCQAGQCQPAACEYFCCPDNEYCEPYHGVYCGGYGVWQWRENRKCRSTLKLAPLSPQFAKLAGLGKSVEAERRYSFQHGSIIQADLISTEPVELVGDVTMVDRAKWHAMTEFALPVFVGSGALKLQGESKLVLGLNSTLSVDGSILFGPQSSLLIPRQSFLQVTNHSIVFEHGASVQIDGTFIFTGGARVHNLRCPKLIQGEGTLAYGDNVLVTECS